MHSLEDLLNITKEIPSKKADNTIKFIHFMEFTPSETRVPFYIVYWFYRKWCEQNKVRATRRVTKHILSRTLGFFYKKKSTYPKTKKFNVRIDYQMVVYVNSPYFPLSKEEEELAFNYYHYIYDQERSNRKELWKTRRKKVQKMKLQE